MDLQITGKSALVTGSYRGTGAGIAHALAAEGVEVFVHGFEPGQPDEVVAAIRAEGGAASPVIADITVDDPEADAALAALAPDILVNNYGAPMGSSWGSIDTWAEEWNRNVLTSVRVAQACTPAMKERGWGRVIFVGTVGSRRPGSRNPGYYAAKAGLPALVRTLALDLRGTGVTANLVSPGIIATTEMRTMLTRSATKRGVGDAWDDVERWALDNTMPNLTERLPDPLDIGRVVAFVASEAAWHITGADLAVDGGTIDA